MFSNRFITLITLSPRSHLRRSTTPQPSHPLRSLGVQMPRTTGGTNKSNNKNKAKPIPKNEEKRTFYKIEGADCEYKEIKDAHEWIKTNGDTKSTYTIQQLEQRGKGKRTVEKTHIYCWECDPSMNKDDDGPTCCTHDKSEIDYIQKWKYDVTNKKWYRLTERWEETRSKGGHVVGPYVLIETPVE